MNISGARSDFPPQPHVFRNSGNYSLTLEPSSSGQSGWRWCERCAGLYYGGNPSRGRCPVQIEPGRPPLEHIFRHSGYVVAINGSGQPGWKHCTQCEGLFFNGNGSLGQCSVVIPGAGRLFDGPHNFAGSANYTLSVPYRSLLGTTRYVITWQTLQGIRLQDDCDEVRVDLGPSGAPPGVTEFFLRAAGAITFVKELRIISPGQPDRFIRTEGDQHGPVGPLEVSAAEINVSTLALSKGKVLNVLTPMYQMNELEAVAGQRVTFNWLRDRCP